MILVLVEAEKNTKIVAEKMNKKSAGSTDQSGNSGAEIGVVKEF